MGVIEVLHEIQDILNQIEEQHKKLSSYGTNIDSYIEKLLLVIENDNFNSAEAYNYCKILKELLAKKRVNDNLQLKYEKLLSILNSKWIRKELSKKEKNISKKQYTARVFNDKKAIAKYLNEDKELL